MHHLNFNIDSVISLNIGNRKEGGEINNVILHQTNLFQVKIETYEKSVVNWPGL